MLRIDHVLLAVRDLDAAAAAVERSYGLGSVVGGRHEGHGTANRIVPLGGDAYLELVAVVDDQEAAGSDFGRRVRAAAGSFLGWSVATDGIDVIAARLGLSAIRLERPNAEGARLSWRLAGLEVALRDPSLPFFISAEMDLSLHPARAAVAHRVRPDGVVRLTVAADPEELTLHLGPGHGLPVDVVGGEPRGVLSVEVGTAEGELTLVPV
jgi:hypothetical protein